MSSPPGFRHSLQGSSQLARRQCLGALRRWMDWFANPVGLASSQAFVQPLVASIPHVEAAVQAASNQFRNSRGTLLDSDFVIGLFDLFRLDSTLAVVVDPKCGQKIRNLFRRRSSRQSHEQVSVDRHVFPSINSTHSVQALASNEN